MNEMILHETFDAANPDPRLRWFCPPESWAIQNSCLVVQPNAKTDFWQKTHYGFEADNGHFLYLEVEGDFILSTRLSFSPAHQYDQAGLMVRVSPDCWLKTSVEYEPYGFSKLGVVLTKDGYSDWSTQDYLDSSKELGLRVRREADDYLVEYLNPSPQEAGEAQRNWVQIRMAHLEGGKDGRVSCGLYACSPIEAGFTARFDFLKIERGRT